MVDVREWAAANAAHLVGTPVAEAADAVTGAGLRPRTAGPGEALTLAFRPDRITLLTDADGVVTEVRAG